MLKHIIKKYYNELKIKIKTINIKEVLNDTVSITIDSMKILCFGYVIGHYGISGTLCIGPSMLPTFNEKGDIVLYDVYNYKFGKKKYDIGDIVISICPYDNTRTVCKRIRALEGQIISVSHPLIPYPQIYKIPKGHVWLAGDNNLNSTDSRSYGPVPIGLLQGRVFVKFKALYNIIPYPILITKEIPNEDIKLLTDDNDNNNNK